MKCLTAILVMLICLLAVSFSAALATETENIGLRILPAPGKMVIDGKDHDWDLSAGIFACGNVEEQRDIYAVRFFAMYDADNLYLLAKWKDPKPLSNDQSSKGGHGFAGDCLQVRFITAFGTPDEHVSHWTNWRDRDGISVMDVAYGRDFKGGNIHDAQTVGAKQAFLIDADGKGYVQEMAIPWKLLTKDGQSLKAGDELHMALEPNFTAGPYGRVSIKDIFKAGIVPDRVFTFRAYDHWGTATLEKAGHVTPRPVRLADAREFPARLDGTTLTVDWTGLIKQREWPGFKPLTFTMPADGYASLNIKDANGNVVRQLLTQNFFSKGPHTVQWDGLATPYWRAPGDVVPAGPYTWEAVTTPGLSLTLRGWASNSGIPWENGPHTQWGGDHGVPAACATDGTNMYLGWDFSEAGKALIACDPDGHVLWRNGSGIGGSVEHLAVDGGMVFGLGWGNNVSSSELFRMRAKDGGLDNWTGHDTAALEIPEIWADKTGMPDRADGMDIKNGKLYLTFTTALLRDTDITDWKVMVAKLQEDTPLAQRIMEHVYPETTRRLKEFLSGKQTQAEAFRTWNGGPFFDREVMREMNTLLAATDLVPGAAQMTADARALANRHYLEQAFAPVVAPLRTNMLAVCDAASGKVQKTIPLPFPHALRAVSDTLCYVISDGSAVLAVNPQTGAVKTVVTGLHNATSVAVDTDGRLYVGVGAPDQQVKTFTADGKAAGTVGMPGGRPRLGPWHPEGLYAIRALVVDARKHLWVMEGDNTPKRVSVWDTASGKFVTEYFGATQYGASGATIAPFDPNVMIGEGCEWRLDPATGQSRCVGVVDNALHSFAVFCAPKNGKTYLAVASVLNKGPRYRVTGIKLFERLAPGSYQLRATIWPDPVWPPETAKQTTFWSDANGDGIPQPEETTTLPVPLGLTGSNGWSMNINPTDLTLYASCPAKQTVYQIPLAGYTPCGAPRWDIANMKELPFAYSKELMIGGNGMLPSKDNRLLVTCEDKYFRCYEVATGKLRWSYPNTFYQVGGSHSAPPSEPGLMRGAFGLIGTFTHPTLGTVWTINGNCGEWYLLSEGGYFVARLFEGDPMKAHFPDNAVPGVDMTNCPPGSGGEDFGGTLTQTPDGKVYIQTGKIGVWNLALNGLDTIKPLAAGTVTLQPEELAQAETLRNAQLQAAVGTKRLEVKSLTPTFTGNIDQDFKGGATLDYKKQDDATVRTGVAWDKTTLYLGWQVRDNTPWINSAAEPAQMYVSGDTVDFQCGADPNAKKDRAEAVAGDFRLSIGNFQGTPTAVLYRKVSAVKKPKVFTSGVIKQYVMDYVDVVPEAQITVKLNPNRQGYTVEAAIPFAALGFTPQADTVYRADFGVTHGNAAGTRTRLRTYWSNQVTGLVDDVVFELMMEPKNWGEVIFR